MQSYEITKILNIRGTNDKVIRYISEGTNLEDETLALLKSALKGDKEAFKKFAESKGKRILTIAQMVLKGNMYADDVLNTVLVKVWQNLDKIIELKSPTGYINTIAYNAAIDIERKRRELPLFDNLPETCKDYETKMDIETALNALSEEERQIVLYHVHAGYSFKKIGELLELTKKAVYIRYLRAVNQLKERLK